MSLSEIVKLYRVVGKPSVRNGSFSAVVPWASDVIDLVNFIRKENDRCFDEILIDGSEYLSSDHLPNSGTSVEFDFKLPQQSSSQFYDSVEHLIERAPDVSKGSLPDEFYIIYEDYYSGDDSSAPNNMLALESIIDLIDGLSHLAHYHDQKLVASKSMRLVFIHPDYDKKIQPAVLETKITNEMLNISPLNTQLIKGLNSENVLNNPHYNAETGVLGNTIVDFINGRSDGQAAFKHLIENWDAFLLLYHKNLSTYLSGFAFHKAKKEVAEAQINLTERFSNVINNISGKLFSIPLSFAAVFAMFKSESSAERFVFLLGLIMASYIIFKAVKNQRQQLIGIIHSKNIIFDALDGNVDTFPNELVREIETMKHNLNNSEMELVSNLRTFYWLCWIPTIVGIVVFLTTYSDIFLMCWQVFATWIFTR